MNGSWWERVAAAGGAAFAALLFSALLLFSLDEVGGGISRADVVATYSDGSTELRKEIGATLVGFAIVCLLFFLGSLRDAVRAVEGERSVLSSAVFAGGVVMAVLLGVSAALETAAVSTDGFFEAYDVDADIPLVLASLSVWTLGFAIVGGGVLVGATSLAALRTDLLPRWLALAGLVVAALAFFGETTVAFVFPVMLVLLWVLIASVLLARRSRVGIGT